MGLGNPVKGSLDPKGTSTHRLRTAALAGLMGQVMLIKTKIKLFLDKFNLIIGTKESINVCVCNTTECIKII